MLEALERVAKEQLGAMSAEDLEEDPKWFFLMLAVAVVVLVLAERKRGGAEMREPPSKSEREDTTDVPLTADDPLWSIVALGKAAERTDLSEHMDDYLAEAYRSEMHQAQ
jgi:hypothetical protein